MRSTANGQLAAYHRHHKPATGGAYSRQNWLSRAAQHQRAEHRPEVHSRRGQDLA
jgi:hypothetical protein